MSSAATSTSPERTTAPSFAPDPKLTSIITRHIPPSTHARVIDIGCRRGDRCYTIARALPAAEITGIERDEAAVRSALNRRGREEGGERVAFIHGDYLSVRRDPVDLIVADASLEDLDGVATSDTRRDALFAKISRELDSDGLLILTLPSECLVNRILGWVRRTLGEKIRLRGKTLASHIPPGILRDDDATRTFLRAVCHLDFLADYPVDPRTPFDLRLRSSVFRKRPSE